jgi:hypothetical protein
MATDPYALTPPKGIIEAKPVIANTFTPTSNFIP